MSVRQRIRRLRRYRTIASAFARNGLGYVTQEMGLADWRWPIRGAPRGGIQTKSVGERIRMLLEELGPTFVKLGQIAGSRPDLLPADIAKELERLQDRVAAFPYEQAREIIENELKVPVDRLFERFYETPLAAASVGQVYHARLKGGAEVAVKVQRPRIRDLVETDLGILADWSKLAEKRLEWARAYRLSDIVDELGKALRAELDYEAEARNAERFANECKAIPHMRVPAVYRQASSNRVLTMAFAEGIRLSDSAGLDRAGLSRRAIAERYASSILRQALVNGFFHADPHPGNVLALPDGSLAWLDFGMMGRLTPEMKNHLISLVVALRNQSSKGVLRAISAMGIVPEDANRDRLLGDIEELRFKYDNVPLKHVRIGETVRDLFAVSLRHRIRMPKELSLLGKTLLTMEGVVSALDPSLSVIEIAEPFGRELFLEKWKPRKAWREWTEELPVYFDLLKDVPLGLHQAARLLKRGKLRFEATAPQMEALLNKMDRISNRLSFSIVLLALSIVMVGLIVGAALNHSHTVLWRVPVIEIGLGIAAFMLAWLLLAIYRSGRF